ncbi:MAG: branched-chain amino acid ABC transporter ATP-binding protein/permease [Rhodomicrobium sp.]
MNAPSAGSDHSVLRSRSPSLSWVAKGVNLPLAAGAFALVIFAATAGPYDLRLLSIAGIYAILVIGFQFLFGFAGAVSLAQSCFFGLGAYVTGILGTHDLGSIVTFPLSIIVPAMVAVIIAVPVLRLDDHYFSLATLAVSLLVELIATQWTSVTGGTNGLSGIPPISLFGVEVGDRFLTMVIVWSLVAVAAGASWQITRGLYGRTFHLMRQSHSAASALGLDVAQMRFSAFVFSAVYAGAAGALIAHVVRVVSPEQLGLPLMVTCLTMTVIGGRLSAAGGIVSALLITYLQEWFRAFENYTMVAYGAVTLAFLIVAPYGLIGALERLRNGLIPSKLDPAPEPKPMPPRPCETGRNPFLLELRGISKSFGGLRAIEDVSLELQPGEIVGLIGPNGSGKTTLLNIISGLYAADKGRVLIDGIEVTKLSASKIARLGVARTFQHIHLVDEMTVLDNIAIGRAWREGSSLWRSLTAKGADDGLHPARQIGMTAAGILGIAEYAMTPCSDLAYGIRRRVEVARAFASMPILLLLDEPAAGLNETEQHDLASRIRTIARHGATLLVVEHNLAFLAALAERLICLDYGRIISSGQPDYVRNDPKVIEAYLGTPA